ncbi:hypothetical protein [Stenotrophomonas sp.]|uniref:hypothetical protein n=1 Tax=Stenotrophomonas sp. TaxID=69392 RepID=UPI0028A5AB32|nr:hypothetical protein [Stenotrophomonas sp.]
MSQFIANLNARRESLGMDVKEVAAELNRRGFDSAYPTVAGWFNGNRGTRWKVKELKALLDILQTDLNSMAGDEAELVEQPVQAQVVKELRALSEAQQQAVLAMIKALAAGR